MTMPRTTNATVPIHWSEVKRLFMSSKRLSTASKRKRATGQGSGPVRSMVRKAPFTLRQPCRRAPAQRAEALAESREDRVRWSGRQWRRSTMLRALQMIDEMKRNARMQCSRASSRRSATDATDRSAAPVTPALP